MVDPQEVRRRLEGEFPGAHIDVANPAGDGEHIEVRVTSPAFTGRGLVEQHRLVYAALGDLMPRIHALQLRTEVAGEGDPMSDVLNEIEREVKANPVVVYMKGTPRFPMCGFSAATVEVLDELGVPYKAVDILAEAAKREAVKAYTKVADDPAGVRRREVHRRVRHRARDARQG